MSNVKRTAVAKATRKVNNLKERNARSRAVKRAQEKLVKRITAEKNRKQRLNLASEISE